MSVLSHCLLPFLPAVNRLLNTSWTLIITYTGPQVGFQSLDLTSALPVSYRQATARSKCPFFELRAVPLSALPHPPPSSIPPEFWPKTGGRKVVKLAVVASISAVSKLAFERRRAARRLCSAIDLVVNRGVGLEGDGEGLVSDREFLRW